MDEAFRALVIRATLDSFWSHASEMVLAHALEVKFMSMYMEVLGLSPTPALRLFPLYHHVSALQVLMILLHFTKPGRKIQQYSTAQHSLAQKASLSLTILWEWEASHSNGPDIILSFGSRKGRYIFAPISLDGMTNSHLAEAPEWRMLFPRIGHTPTSYSINS
jgi:hypothetical protein